MVSYPPRRPAPMPTRPIPAAVTNAAATAPAARPAMAPVAKTVQSPVSAARPDMAADVVVYRLKPGDPIIMNLRGIPGGDQQIEDQIDEGGWDFDCQFSGNVLAIEADDGTQIIVHSTTIENVQKHYYRYDVLIPDIKDLNDFMKDIRIKEAFRISRFDWEK